VKDCVLAARTVALLGVMETVIAATVIVTEADFVVSLTDVAVSFTVRPVAGAVPYMLSQRRSLSM
jgi:hypothetical protein